MDRREFLGTIAGGLLAAPLAAEAQQARKVPRVGFLVLARNPGVEDSFRRGLMARSRLGVGGPRCDHRVAVRRGT